MITTILIVLLVGLSVWLYLGGPMPNLIPKQQRARTIILAWMALRSHISDETVRSKLDELLPLLLKEEPRA